MTLIVQISGEDLRIFINAAILQRIPGLLQKLMMLLEPANKEKNLRMESPAIHILVEIRQIGVFCYRFHHGVPTQLAGEKCDEGGLADANIAGDRNEICGHKMTRARKWIAFRGT